MNSWTVPEVLYSDTIDGPVVGDGGNHGTFVTSDSLDLDEVKSISFVQYALTVSGTSGAGHATMQGSLDNTNWYNLGATVGDTSGLNVSVSYAVPARFIRVLTDCYTLGNGQAHAAWNIVVTATR